MSSKSVAPFKSSNLVVQTTELNGAGILCCSGKMISNEDAVQLLQSVDPFLDRSTDVVIDVSAVEELDLSCITELVIVRMKAHAAGCLVVLAGPSADFLLRLQWANIASLFHIHSSLEQAMASLPARNLLSA